VPKQVCYFSCSPSDSFTPKTKYRRWTKMVNLLDFVARIKGFCKLKGWSVICSVISLKGLSVRLWVRRGYDEATASLRKWPTARVSYERLAYKLYKTRNPNLITNGCLACRLLVYADRSEIVALALLFTLYCYRIVSDIWIWCAFYCLFILVYPLTDKQHFYAPQNPTSLPLHFRYFV